VAIRAESSGRWWNGTTRTWESAYVTNVASLASAGSKATSWDYSFAAPFNGGEFFAQAEAIDDRGRRDPVVAKSTFTVRSLGNAPETSITEPVFKQVYPFPAQGRQPVPVTIRGTAVDSGGARPGISKVLVVIRNVEHGDHWCGPSCADGAPDAHNPHWTAARTAVEATLQQPGHPSTEWSLTFWTYDHPHKYHISAAARDLDGERDPVPAMVDRICVRDPGDNSCV
jgi:hypothetical protein